MRRKLISILLCLTLGAGSLTGCGGKGAEDKTKVVLTTGFEKDEVFRIDGISCKVPEITVYLTNTQNQYEKVYGSQIWQTDLEGVTLEENVKDMVLAKIAQIKSMNLLAKEQKITLNDTEKELVSEAAESYYTSLNEAEVQNMQVTRELIIRMYTEYAVAEKVYYNIIKDINPEISDDEARTITVEQILIKTYSLNGSGEKVPYTEIGKQEAGKKAEEALKRAEAGEDFDGLIAAYNEDNKSIYSFGKGEMTPEFEEAAFNLGKDEISKIVETEYGYHIIKCLNTFNREETDANKIKIVEQRKKEVFSQEYDAFVDSLNKNLNTELWSSITLLHDEQVKTADFFDVYQEFLGGQFNQKNTGL